MKFGITLTRRQCEWLGLNFTSVMKEMAGMPLTWVRLGVYWDEVEKVKGQYNFELITEELDLATELGLSVCLTLGMKAPRWPEFHIPEMYEIGLEEKDMITPESSLAIPVVNLLERAIDALQGYDCIRMWQVENEPLDSSGPKRHKISPELLQIEIDRIVALDNRKILLSLWGNTLKESQSLEMLKNLKNVTYVGLDLYEKQYVREFETYHGPDVTISEMNTILTELREFNFIPIITELQAEPWEESFDYRKHPERIASISMQNIENSIRKYQQLDFEMIWLWGAEYWCWAKMQKEVADLLVA